MVGKYAKKKVTIKDVAREAGVSISTVSRVLNEMDIVKPEKEELVRAAIEKLNYRPDPAARSLGQARMTSVAVMVPNINNSCIAEMVHGVFDVLKENDISIVLFDSRESKEIEKRNIEYIQEKSFDGLIFITGCDQNKINFARVAEEMPVALIDISNRHKSIDNLVINNKQGMSLVFDYLWQKGHRRIALLAGQKPTFGSQRRLDAYKDELKKHEVEFDEELVVYSEWSRKGGKKAFEKLLGKDVTAVMCSSDFLAIGALSAAWENGIRVPQDISIVGYDNFHESEFTIPPLTSLSFPGYRMGKRAGQLLLDRFQRADKKDEFLEFSMKLVERQSVSNINQPSK